MQIFGRRESTRNPIAFWVDIGDVSAGGLGHWMEEEFHIASETFFAVLDSLLQDEEIRARVYNLLHARE